MIGVSVELEEGEVHEVVKVWRAERKRVRICKSLN